MGWEWDCDGLGMGLCVFGFRLVFYFFQEQDKRLQELEQLRQEKKVSMELHPSPSFLLLCPSLVISMPHISFSSFLPPSPSLPISLPSSQDYEAKMEELEAALVKQLQTDTAVEKLEEQRKMFMSKLEELETSLSQKHNEVRQAAASGQTDEYRRPDTVYSLSVSGFPSSSLSRLSE